MTDVVSNSIVRKNGISDVAVGVTSSNNTVPVSNTTTNGDRTVVDTTTIESQQQTTPSTDEIPSTTVVDATATTTSPTTTAVVGQQAKKLKKKIGQHNNKDNHQREYNPLWKGYTYLLVSSLINMSAVSNVHGDEKNFEEQQYYPTTDQEMQIYIRYKGNMAFNVTLGAVTFTYALLVLIADRTGLGIPVIGGGDNDKKPSKEDDDGSKQKREVYHYNTILDGKFEGYCLLISCLWWIIGVAYQTQVQGIAYVALNIYFSSWLSLIACIYTLEKWSASKDILSFEELTGLSLTLRSWYILFLSSLVVTGTSINMLATIYGDDGYADDSSSNSRRTINYLAINSSSPAAFGVAFGIVSTITSIIFILLHYNLIDCYGCTEGSWWELTAAVTLLLMWIIGVATMTQHGGIGATVTGMPFQSVFLPNITTISLISNTDYVDTNVNINIDDATVDYIAYTASITSQDDLFNNTNQENMNTTLPPSNIVDSILSSTCQLTYSNNLTSATSNETLIITYSCSEFIPSDYIEKYETIPGSNMYIFVWLCLASSLNITFRWKAQQALSFAQAQQEKAFQQITSATSGGGARGGGTGPMDDDDDIDMLDENNNDNSSTMNRHHHHKYNHDDDDDDQFIDADMY